MFLLEPSGKLPHLDFPLSELATLPRLRTPGQCKNTARPSAFVKISPATPGYLVLEWAQPFIFCLTCCSETTLTREAVQTKLLVLCHTFICRLQHWSECVELARFKLGLQKSGQIRGRNPLTTQAGHRIFPPGCLLSEFFLKNHVFF